MMNKPDIQQQEKKGISLSFSLKFGAIGSLLLLSILVIACGNTPDSTAATFGPAPTVTIQIGNANNGSPIPTGAKFWCGAWATQATPNLKTTSQIGVYGKFLQNVNGNTRGIGDADVQALVIW